MVPLLVAGLLTACSGTKTVTGADSSAVKTDSTQTMSTSSADSTTAMADTTFAAKAAISGMAEVDLGKMAAAKGTAKEVKDFGQMMVMDHGKANAELMSIAKNKNITLPAGLDAEHQAKSDSLSKLTGQDFDKGYVAVMIEDHKKTLALMQSEASNGKDADLKAFAAKTAPVVQHHLEDITKIQQGLK
jgi:putative membrane protein